MENTSLSNREFTLLFGVNLNRVMHNMNVTSKELAAKADINYSQITAYKRGRQLPTLQVAKHLSKTLGCSLDSLCLEDNHQNKAADKSYFADESNMTYIKFEAKKKVSDLLALAKNLRFQCLEFQSFADANVIDINKYTKELVLSLIKVNSGCHGYKTSYYIIMNAIEKCDFIENDLELLSKLKVLSEEKEKSLNKDLSCIKNKLQILISDRK